MMVKRCEELNIPHYNPQTHKTTGVWSLIQLVSLYTVPLSAVNGLSRLTKLTMGKGQARPIFNLKNFKSANPFRIESQAPNKKLKFWTGVGENLHDMTLPCPCN